MNYFDITSGKVDQDGSRPNHEGGVPVTMRAGQHGQVWWRLSKRPMGRRQLSWCGVGPVRMTRGEQTWVAGVAAHAGPWLVVIGW